MKEIQSQIKTFTIASAALVLIAVSLLSIPALESIREAFAAKIGLSGSTLWIPIAGILAVFFFGIHKRLETTVANPIQALARHVREGESSGYNFRRKARNREEVALRGYIESHDLKISEVKEQRDELEKELKIACDERDIALSINNRQTTEIADLNRALKKLRVEAQTLAAAKEVLEASLESERKTKVGREVKLRAEEIYSQVERAVSEASARSIWIPNLLSQIETPTLLINDLSKRLESSWNELSLAKLSEEISKIREQSDLQCSLLEGVDPDGLIAVEPPRSKPVETVEEAPSRFQSGELLIGDDIAANPETRPVYPGSNSIDPSEEIEESPQPSPAEPVEAVTNAPSLVLEPTSPEEAITTEIETADEERVPQEEPEASPTAELDLTEAIVSEEPESIEAQPDPETLSALQTLVFELVNDYSQEVEKISVEADLSDDLDVEVDEELLESVLSNLLEIAIYQWREGSVKLRVSRQDNQITFAVDSKGKPLAYGELDESQNNRIASALDRKIDVDMPSDSELRMRYRYVPDEA